MSRNLLHRVGIVLLLGTFAAACGDSDSESSEKKSPSNPVVGAYDATLVVNRSTDKDTKTGEESKETTPLFFSCADEACESLYQRGFDFGKSTMLLKPTADGYSGTKTVSASCEGTSGPKYTATTTYTWKRGSDGTMTGARTDEVTGCRASTSAATWIATPNPQAAIPYLTDKAQATTIIDAYRTFGTSFTEFLAAYGKCETDDAESTSLSESKCLGRSYQQYEKALKALGDSVKTVAVESGTACATAITRFKYDELASQYNRAARLLLDAKNGPEIDKGFDTLNKLLTFDQEQTDAMRSVALMCTEPADSELFGEGGALSVDPGALLRAEGNT